MTRTQYETHANRCRTLAESTAKPEDKRAFEELAQTWDLLAKWRHDPPDLSQMQNQDDGVPPDELLMLGETFALAESIANGRSPAEPRRLSFIFGKIPQKMRKKSAP